MISVNHTQNLLDLLRGVLGFDFGICGSNRIALAGTGSYKNNLGKTRPETHLSEVINTGHLLVLKSIDRSPKCMDCHNKGTCFYKGAVIHPLILNNQSIGAIYTLTKKAIYSNEDIIYHSGCLEKLSSFLVELIKIETMSYEKENYYLKYFMNLCTNGLMTLDKQGMIRNINASAKKIFDTLPCDESCKPNIRDYLPDVQLESAEITYSYKDIFKINIQPIADVGYVLHAYPRDISNIRKLDFIIGNSDEIRKAKEHACIIAKKDTPVLLLGETGTGKELFAQAIHNLSSRASKEMITVDCSTIPANLLESELFGYVDGAFTGANPRGKKGRIEASHMSSVFLDEIAELPLHLQSKFLRVIENNSFTKIGDIKTTSVNTRIIAATNRNLRQMVQAGTFREDLYYRLNVMSLDIPPLRMRGNDIIILSDYFLKHHNSLLKKNIQISDKLRPFFAKYKWPGNVRELKNLIEYSVAFAINNYITFESLPRSFKEHIIYEADKNNSTEVTSIKSAEKDFIEKSLILYGNSIKGKKEAARTLGISLSSLYRKLKKYNLN